MKLVIIAGMLLNVFPGLISQLKAETELEGFWQMPTGNLIVAIEQQQISFYEVTRSDEHVGIRASCYQLSEKQLQYPLEFYLPVDLSRYFLTTNDQLSFIDHGALYNPKLQKISQLPSQCGNSKQLNRHYQHQPLIDLDIVWNTFSQHYGFLALRGIIQRQGRAKYIDFKNKALKTTDAKQLFALLSEVLETAAGEKNLSGVIISADDHVDVLEHQIL